ncbi:MAG: nitrite reductase, copper-containing [Thermomicrobiaceae bacterium]|nr:nitrite reductase, copper-containing [Thermomicrobiaceae bacterium]
MNVGLRHRWRQSLAVGAAALLLAVGTVACGEATGTATQTQSGAAPQATVAAPVDAPQLPNPAVAPPVGQRGPQLVTYELEAKEVVGQLDKGVGFKYWTFNGTVPGPMLRVREGNTVQITLKNAPGTLTAHSIDLHAVSGPGGGGGVSQVNPGHTAVFQFKAETPGVYVYHCATPPAAMHIAMGMYGLIVVEPAGGLPKVDHEFYVMQGEFYIDGKRGQAGMHDMDSDKMFDENPDYVVFNGSVGSLTGERELRAKTGETIRIFFGNAGPDLPSSVHVIGQVMKRVAVEGGSLWNTDVQTTLVPPGGATIFEIKPDVPGDYMLVDHALSRVLKGAAAAIHVDGPENPDVFKVIQPGDAGTGGH